MKPEQTQKAHITVEVDFELVATIRDLKSKFKSRGERFSITSLIVNSVNEAMIAEDNKPEETLF